jgi:hypothetical protein
MEADLNPKEKGSRNNSRSNDAPFFLPLFPTYSGPTENEHGMSPLPEMSPFGGDDDKKKMTKPKPKAKIEVEVVSENMVAFAGIKPVNSTDPWQAHTVKGYIKVAGEWKFFDKRLQTGFSTSLETDFAKAPKWSADWRTVYFPNGTLTPELVLGLVIGDKGLTRKVEPSINIQLSNWLSLKAGAPITLGPDNKFNVTPGVGFTMSF